MKIIDDIKKARDDAKQTYKDQELVKMVDDEFERRRTERMPDELQWMLNINFQNGNQYCDINGADCKIIQKTSLNDDYEQRQVFNKIASIVDTIQSGLNKVSPVMIVQSASAEQDDVNCAKVSTRVLRSAYEQLNALDKIKIGSAWCIPTGTVFYKSVWDSEAGEALSLSGESISEGDIDFCVVPPFEIFPDSCFVQELDDCTSIIHAKAMKVDAVYEKWSKKVKGEQVPAFAIGQTGLQGNQYSTATVQQAMLDDSVIVKEYYERPSKKYENGRHIITAGSTLLHSGELLYKNGKNGKKDFPFVKQVYILKAGYFWGESIVSRCIPVQRAYNAVINRKHEILNRQANSPLLTEKGSLSDETQLDEVNYPGAILEINPGMNPPKYMEVPRVTAELLTESERLDQQFTDISGVSELSRTSQAPAGLESGLALQILSEKDNSRLAVSADNVRKAVKAFAKQWLRLYKQYADTQRMAKITDESEVSTIWWDKSKLNSDDIIFETEDELNDSPAQRRMTAYNFLNAGLFLDPDTGRIDKASKAWLFEVLGVDSSGQLEDITVAHRKRAQKESLNLAEGAPAYFYDGIDDNEIHIETHIKFMISNEFNKYFSKDPKIYDLFNMHIKQHRDSLAMLTGQAQALQQVEQLTAENEQLQQELGAKEQSDMAIQGTEQEQENMLPQDIQ